MREDAVLQFVHAVFPTSRMDEMLDAIVASTLRTHATEAFQQVAHQAVVATIEFTEEEPNEARYEVFSMPTPNINDMYEFAGFMGGYIARLGPDKVMVGSWLIGEAWILETDKAMPTKVLPSEHPDRKEVLVIAGISLDNRRNHAIILFDRDEDRNIIVHPENAEVFHVDDGVKAYSKNTKHLRNEYLMALREKL